MLTDIRKKLEQKKGKRDLLEEDIHTKHVALGKQIQKLKDIQEAQDIIQTVSKATQQELEFHVAEVATLAEAAIFPDPYRVCLDFELRRHKSEADITFCKGEDGERIDPLTGGGGGPCDVAAFGLRVALWSLRSPRARGVLVLDEPFRFVSRDLQERASGLLKEISVRLGLQMIIVTHEETLIENADKVFMVTQRKGRSQVEESINA